MDGKSIDVLSDKLSKLKKIIPEAFTENKIDWEKLKAAFGEDINFENERYNLNWAGKSDAFRVLQQRTSASLKPVKEESVNFDVTENIFIEGENLEVLKVLQKSYFGKIKMIYIDPPYNTGNDNFIYPDKFSETKDEYLKRIGDKDEDGYLLKEGFFRKNSKDGGHYHSNWLTMMYPRLYIARNLLKDDGVIFVSIDDNEVHNLRMIMNEIFGEENFLAQFVWQKKYGPANDAKQISFTHEYILLYARNALDWKPILYKRNKEQLEAFKNPDNDKRGPWRASDLSARTASEKCIYPITLPSGRIVNPPPSRSWIINEDSYNKLVKEKRIWYGIDGNGRPMQKKFLTEVRNGITPQTWWDREFAADNKIARYEIKEIFPENIFDTPKPAQLINRILQLSTEPNKNEIVLDFFSGSGTTAQAVMELNKEDGGNRKFILVQLPEKTSEESEAYKAGYKTIADICKERIRRVITRNLTPNPSPYKGEGLFTPNPSSSQGEGLFTSNSSTSKEAGVQMKSGRVRPDLFSNSDNAESSDIRITDQGFKVFKLAPSNFKMWRSDVIETEEDLNNMMGLFDTQVKPEMIKENILYELMLKSGFALTDTIENKDGYYSINNSQAVFVLDKVDSEVVERIVKLKPQNCVILDVLFAGNDQLKTNTALQMKDAGVEFVTI